MGRSRPRWRDPREVEQDAGHSLAGRVHLSCVKQVDAAFIGDGHQLLSHLREQRQRGEEWQEWPHLIPHGEKPLKAQRGSSRAGRSVASPAQAFGRAPSRVCIGLRSTKTQCMDLHQLPFDSSWEELISSHGNLLIRK